MFSAAEALQVAVIILAIGINSGWKEWGGPLCVLIGFIYLFMGMSKAGIL